MELSNRAFPRAPKPMGAPAIPPLFNVLQKAINYKIPYQLMTRLHYLDLLLMIVNYEIQAIEEYMKSKKDDSEVEIHEVRPEEVGYAMKKTG